MTACDFGASAFGWGSTSLVALVVVMAMATLLTPVVGVSLERFGLPAAAQRPPVAPLITALGASFALQQLVAVFYSRSFLSFPTCSRTPRSNCSGRVQTLWVFMIAVALLLTFTLTAFIRTTRLARPCGPPPRTRTRPG